MGKIVHLAGNYVQFSSRIIQRCLVCGTELADVDINKLSYPTQDDMDELGIFAVGHLVEVTDGIPTTYCDIGFTEKPNFDYPWENCCIYPHVWSNRGARLMDISIWLPDWNVWMVPNADSIKMAIVCRTLKNSISSLIFDLMMSGF